MVFIHAPLWLCWVRTLRLGKIEKKTANLYGHRLHSYEMQDLHLVLVLSMLVFAGIAFLADFALVRTLIRVQTMVSYVPRSPTAVDRAAQTSCLRAASRPREDVLMQLVSLHANRFLFRAREAPDALRRRRETGRAFVMTQSSGPPGLGLSPLAVSGTNPGDGEKPRFGSVEAVWHPRSLLGFREAGCKTLHLRTFRANSSGPWHVCGPMKTRWGSEGHRPRPHSTSRLR